MAIIDVVKYSGPASVLAWKFPNSELSSWSQLIVNESQEAVFFKGGQVLDVLGPGTHTLDSNNIPILTTFLKLPFGGQSPFSAEVWFVNKAHSLDIKWGTPTPIQIQDPKFGIIIPVRSFGQFGVMVENSKKFLVKLVGTTPVFDQESLTKFFRGLYLTRVKDTIASYLIKRKISVLEISACLTELSDHTRELIKPTLDDYGLNLLNFYVNDINFPENDPTVLKLKDALAKRAEMDILGFDYRQERTFNALEGAAKNPGQGNLMGAGLGLGVGLETGRALGAQMAGQLSGQVTQPGPTPAQSVNCPKCGVKATINQKFCQNCGGPIAPPKDIVCDKCGAKMTSDAKFCPQCGDPYNPCPNCGQDLPSNSSNCPSCGFVFPKPCPLCGRPLTAANSKFCPSCGGTLIKKCSQCQIELPPTTKFCPSCGQQV
ncbi:MAG: SPFH domain-containing protein [Deltaproteobacteria bacterium]|jgi:membrane protease subunit (stomatin/prohibitin family)|nr:SPFH domain-containing protein [Deltaproteobacteria bacterium]